MQQKLKAILRILLPVVITAGAVSSGVIDCKKLIECITGETLKGITSTGGIT